jgi:uncharacterized membrane protein YdbT with pleckstrin-like domain
METKTFKSKASQIKNLKHFIISLVSIVGYFIYQAQILKFVLSVYSDINHFINLPVVDIKQWALYVVLLYPLYTIWQMLVVYNEEYIFKADRLIISSGVLNKKSDFLEYFRIKDYTITHSLIERILGLCSIEIISTDRSNPLLNLTKIKDFSQHEPILREGIDLSMATGRGREVDIV